SQAVRWGPWCSARSSLAANPPARQLGRVEAVRGPAVLLGRFPPPRHQPPPPLPDQAQLLWSRARRQQHAQLSRGFSADGPSALTGCPDRRFVESRVCRERSGSRRISAHLWHCRTALNGLSAAEHLDQTLCRAATVTSMQQTLWLSSTTAVLELWFSQSHSKVSRDDASVGSRVQLHSKQLAVQPQILDAAGFHAVRAADREDSAGRASAALVPLAAELAGLLGPTIFVNAGDGGWAGWLRCWDGFGSFTGSAVMLDQLELLDLGSWKNGIKGKHKHRQQSLRFGAFSCQPGHNGVDEMRSLLKPIEKQTCQRKSREKANYNGLYARISKLCIKKEAVSGERRQERLPRSATSGGERRQERLPRSATSGGERRQERLPRSATSGGERRQERLPRSATSGGERSKSDFPDPPLPAAKGSKSDFPDPPLPAEKGSKRDFPNPPSGQPKKGQVELSSTTESQTQQKPSSFDLLDPEAMLKKRLQSKTEPSKPADEKSLLKTSRSGLPDPTELLKKRKGSSAEKAPIVETKTSDISMEPSPVEKDQQLTDGQDPTELPKKTKGSTAERVSAEAETPKKTEDVKFDTSSKEVTEASTKSSLPEPSQLIKKEKPKADEGPKISQTVTGTKTSSNDSSPKPPAVKVSQKPPIQVVEPPARRELQRRPIEEVATIEEESEDRAADTDSDEAWRLSSARYQPAASPRSPRRTGGQALGPLPTYSSSSRDLIAKMRANLANSQPTPAANEDYTVYDEEEREAMATARQNVQTKAYLVAALEKGESQASELMQIMEEDRAVLQATRQENLELRSRVESDSRDIAGLESRLGELEQLLQSVQQENRRLAQQLQATSARLDRQQQPQSGVYFNDDYSIGGGYFVGSASAETARLRREAVNQRLKAELNTATASSIWQGYEALNSFRSRSGEDSVPKQRALERSLTGALDDYVTARELGASARRYADELLAKYSKELQQCSSSNGAQQ
uniref:MHD domain-containing protein n=1 Tax=Macrostomum lignano TaxID=282301 RepID=A0A1I8IGX1_9PLAT